MTYAAGSVVSQFGELLFISCCCKPHLFLAPPDTQLTNP